MVRKRRIPLAVGSTVKWRDVLPPGLATGPVRALAYRVELRNAAGKAAGFSEAAYAAAGNAPPAVEHFVAEGVRSGVLLQWSGAAGTAELLVRRERLDGASTAVRRGRRAGSRSPAEAAPASRRGNGAGKASRLDADREEAMVWLKSSAAGPGAPEMVDGTIAEGVRYRYTALRSETVRVGGRTLEVRSAASAGVEIAWRDVYPPPVPQGLTALGFATASGQGRPQAYAVDLVWEPVNDPRVTGYVVERQRLGAAGQAVEAAERLTAEPVSTPGFHDAGAVAGVSYRYRVTAVDAKGNVSAPAVAGVGPRTDCEDLRRDQDQGKGLRCGWHSARKARLLTA